ncbi:NB-ARC domain, LRR domain containing protein [Parasponia andersonii]|uniref:NB-ARC domain, LRR domain containing protein n=1 Tax=Parasponia andersonii TaxID=3476 RepID=A0A2P5BGM1_PARAD|nr:NB-ARC domain, LRR domain containing protein [Parasponia andersonii]
MTSSDVNVQLKLPDTTSFLDVPVVYGQDNYKKTLIDQLRLSGSSHEDMELKFIPTVGMGGIGKTTLAKNIFNDGEVKTCFKGQRILVCVSQPFEIVKIAKEIIEQLIGQTPTVVGSEALIQRFHESIKGKKFLLVLDDVWTTRNNEWAPLEQVLWSGAAGSRVVVTTRNEKVAKMIGRMHMICLNKLSEADCWSLLSKIAFYGKTEQEREAFAKIGKKVARKCNGLSLAAKTLGSLLRVKKIEEWLDVLERDIWDLENVKEDLFNPLLLSYYDLPSVERRCFSYCAIFPRDYEFDRDDLIQQWIAQGYFKPKKNEQEVELLGQICFENLAERSFFQATEYEHDNWNRSNISCKMHDIVHYFAQYLTMKEYSAVSVFDTEKRVDLNARHLSLTISPVINVPTISISNKTSLHSLMVFYNSSNTYMFPIQFLNLTRLRTLSLSGPLMELPTNIGDLIHLRYLNLSYANNIMQLPPTIGNLLNLQTLRLFWCSITIIPEEVGKLINLRHLYAIQGGDLTWSKSIGELRSLQTLKKVHISPKSENFQLRDFRNLNGLRKIYVTGLGIEEHLEEAEEAKFHKKSALVDLAMEFYGDDTKMETHEIVLETLGPHENLQSLVIARYCGRSFSPSWMMSLVNLRELALQGCHMYETSFPPLGKFPCLESLDIVGSYGLKKLGPEFLGVETDNRASYPSKFTSRALFPKLKLLSIHAPSLCEWVGVPGWKVNGPLKIMPRLESLLLRQCRSLKSLPDFLESTPLERLIIKYSPALQESCQEKTGQDWHKIRHVPNIHLSR